MSRRNDSGDVRQSLDDELEITKVIDEPPEETASPDEPVSVAPPKDPRAPVSSFATSRPVAVLMVFLAAVVFGVFSCARLPVTLMPELTYPTITVRTEYPGAAPEEVENDVSRPVEEALGVIGGLRRISSVSRAGLSDVVLELAWDTEISDATQDVLERLDQVFLPSGAEQPLILHYDPSLDPVMELSLAGAGDRFAGEAGLRRLRRIGELQVKRALEPIKGVAAVRVRGGLEEEIHVLIDEEELERTGIPVGRVIERLRQENVNVAGGTIEEGRTEYMVRTLNEYQDLGQIEATILATIDGRDVRVRDVGRVVRSQRDREILTRTDGAESVQIDIYKEADANIVDLAERVTAAIGLVDADLERPRPGGGRGEGGGRRGPPRGEAQKSDGPPPALAQELFWDEGVRLGVVADRSVFIESSVDEVKNTAVLGGLLAVLVLFLFLKNLRTTLIIAVAIPISLAVTFAPLHLAGISLNIMSLGGLALGIGMLVDSSIVVLESIFRCREEGDGLAQGAVRGTSEVRGAVIASTLTSIAVFFPMVFVEGIAGQAFGDLGVAVVVSLLASLVVAVFFVPMLASRQGVDLAEVLSGRGVRFARWGSGIQFRRDLGAARPWAKVILFPYLLLRLLVSTVLELAGKLVLGLVAALTWVLARALPPVARLGRAVSKPFTGAADRGMSGLQNAYPRFARAALGASGMVIVLTLVILAGTVWLMATLPTELLPEVHQGEVTFEVALPVGTPLEQTVATLDAVEDAVLQDARESDQIETVLVTFGFDAENAQSSDEGEHSAQFKLLLASSSPLVEEEVVGRIRERLAQVPDLDSRVTRPVLFSSKTPIQVEVHGDELGRLKEMADRVAVRLAALPELADVETTLESGAPEVQIVYDRDRLARYGLDLRGTAELVRNQVQGFEASRFNMQDRRIPIVVRLQAADRESVADVQDLVVNPGGERPIALGAVADVTLGEGPSEVRRVDGQRVALVEANLGSGASLGAAVTAIDGALAELDWPADMNYYITGQNEEWERSQGSLWLALGLSIFLVYVIMAAQFENLIHPLVILFTIPLAFFGTSVALAWLGLSLSVVVFLGMIMLAGIVVNNAIVLVDYINTLRRRGMEVTEAITTAGAVRLRPILMTTATTVLGLLPMAFGLGDGAEIRTPMAIAVIGGLVTSTLLTLVVIPVIYALFDRLQAALLGRREVDRVTAEEVADQPHSDAPGLPAGVPGVTARERTV